MPLATRAALAAERGANEKLRGEGDEKSKLGQELQDALNKVGALAWAHAFPWPACVLLTPSYLWPYLWPPHISVLFHELLHPHPYFSCNFIHSPRP